MADPRRGRAGHRAAVGEEIDRGGAAAASGDQDIPAFAAEEGRSLSHPADHLDREGLASGDGREAGALRCRSRSDLGRGHPDRLHLRDRHLRPPPDGAAVAAGQQRLCPRPSGSPWPWPPPPAPPASSAVADSPSGAHPAAPDSVGRCPTTPAATQSALRRYWDSCICRTKSLRGTWGSWRRW